MKNIITIQHPESTQHVNGMIGSWGDWKLTDKGILDANTIGKRLSLEIADKGFVMYSSDLLRTKVTAEIIGSYLDIKPAYSKALREFNLGDANGKSKMWVRNNCCCNVWPGTIDWGEKIDDRPFKGAESKRDVWMRLQKFLEYILLQEEQNIIIVSHDGTLSIFFALWLGMNIEKINNVNISGCSGGVSFLNEDKYKNRIVHRLNDLSYMNSGL